MTHGPLSAPWLAPLPPESNAGDESHPNGRASAPGIKSSSKYGSGRLEGEKRRSITTKLSTRACRYVGLTSFSLEHCSTGTNFLEQSLTLVNNPGVPSQDSPPVTSAPRAKRSSALACIEVLGQLADLFERRKRQLAEHVGLSVQQWHVLEVVQLEHFMPSLFAQAQDRSPAAVSKILRQLTDKGLIAASVSEVDARQRNYIVTAQGKEVLAALRADREAAIEKVWLNLTQDELNQFEALGRKLAERIELVAHPRCTER